MNKRDIINKLVADKMACECLLASSFASDMQIRLQSKLDYVTSMLEWIQQGGKA